MQSIFIFLLILNFFITISIAQQHHHHHHHVPTTIFCGKIKIQEPFLSSSNSALKNMIICKSQKLYFKTTLGLFSLSSIDYNNKTLTISHSSSSSSTTPRNRRSLNEEAEAELGTRISFDVPDHVPEICKECDKANGNCGVGLKCVCHPKECRDKVVSLGASLNPITNIIFSLVSLTAIMLLWRH